MRLTAFFLAILPSLALAGQTVTIPADPDLSARLDAVERELDAMHEPACDPDVTFGTAGDYDPADGATLNQAFHATPLDGTLGILPGHYRLTNDAAGLWRKLRGQKITVCGPGARPVIRADEGAAWAFLNGSFEVRNVSLWNIEITSGALLKGSLTITNVYLGDTRNECLTTSPVPQLGASREGNQQGDPTEFHRITLTNVRFEACGDGDHAAYIATRGCVLRATGLHVEHPSGLEGFRSLCRVNVISDSYFANVIGDPAAAGAGTQQGASPLQVVACAATILRDSRIEIVGDRGKTGLWVAARRSITGCDMPNWTPREAGEMFWRAGFWSGVNSRPVTDPFNPHIFPLFISGSTFVFHDVGEPGGGNIAIKDAGTYPAHRVGPYSTRSIYKDVPDDDPDTLADEGWSERHVVFTADNVFRGWDADYLGEGFGAPPHPDSDDGALIDRPAREWVDYGATVPDWWPGRCLDLAARHGAWWDEPGNHRGFPEC